MHRTTIMLPDELKVQARIQARAQGVSLAEFIRAALEQAMIRSKADVSQDPLFADVEVFEGETPADLASHHDDYLYGGTER